jgi:hypothetical protein
MGTAILGVIVGKVDGIIVGRAVGRADGLMLGSTVGRTVGIMVGVADGEVGATSDTLEEILTVLCEVAHPAIKIMVDDPEEGIVNDAEVLATRVEVQPVVPVNAAPPVACNTYSPEVEDKEIVRDSPYT